MLHRLTYWASMENVQNYSNCHICIFNYMRKSQNFTNDILNVDFQFCNGKSIVNL